MLPKTKFIFIVLQERNGEYEYRHKLARQIPFEAEMAEWVEKQITSQFYDSESEQANGGYYFRAGEVFVRTSSIQEISDAEYKVLNCFI
jgi:DUF1365 family protein